MLHWLLACKKTPCPTPLELHFQNQRSQEEEEADDEMEINVRSDVQGLAETVQKKAEKLKSAGRLDQAGLGAWQGQKRVSTT